MGCDAQAFIPVDVDARDASLVMGILAGLPPHKEPLKGCDGEYVDVKGVKVVPSDFSLGYGQIELSWPGKHSGGMVDSEQNHSCHFHCGIRGPGNKMYNMVSAHASPFWCAMMRRLVQWFGGIVLFNDCEEEKGKNILRSKRNCPADKWGLMPEDNKDWYRYQDALMALKAISPEEIKRAIKVAAYAEYYDENGMPKKLRGVKVAKA